MKIVRILIAAAMFAVAPVQAREATVSVPAGELVPFSSDEGLARLARSTAKADFAALANQFEAQTNTMFCGPTTAAIVLNAINARSSALPRDRSRLRQDDFRYLSPTADPVIPRFTQDNVIKGPKTRAQVMGEPMRINGKTIKDYGYQARQFEAMMKSHGMHTRLVIVDDKLPLDQIRQDLIGNLKRHGDYVVVGYHRKAVGQKGGGHISPLAAYDEKSDSFLIMDVNPNSAGWVWMPAETLVRGMRTFDTVENRGYLHVAPSTSAQ